MIMNFLFCSQVGLLVYIIYFLYQYSLATEQMLLKIQQLEKLVAIDKEIATTQLAIIDNSILESTEITNNLLKFLIIGTEILYSIYGF